MDPEPVPLPSSGESDTGRQVPSDPPLPEVSWHGIRLDQHKPSKRRAEMVHPSFEEQGDIDHRTFDGNLPVSVKYQRTEDNPLRRFSSRHVASARTEGEGGSSASSSWQRTPASLAMLAQLTNADGDPLDVGSDPADPQVGSESGTRSYEAATNLGPLSIRVYHDWRRRHLRRSGSQS